MEAKVIGGKGIEVRLWAHGMDDAEETVVDRVNNETKNDDVYKE